MKFSVNEQKLMKMKMSKKSGCCSLDCWVKVIAWIRLMVSGILFLTLLSGLLYLTVMSPLRRSKMIAMIQSEVGALVKSYPADGLLTQLIRIFVLMLVEISTLSGLGLLVGAYQRDVNLLSDWTTEMIVFLIVRILIVAPIIFYTSILDVVFTFLSLGIVNIHMGNLQATTKQQQPIMI